MPDKRGWIVLDHGCYSLRQLHANLRECFVPVSTWNVSAQVGPWHVPMMSLANENNSKVHWLEAFEMLLWSCRGGAKSIKLWWQPSEFQSTPCGGSFPCLDSLPVSWQEEQNSFSKLRWESKRSTQYAVVFCTAIWNIFQMSGSHIKYRHSQMHLNNPDQSYDKIN